MQNSRSGYKLLLPVLGVVFGDIGTSPIYTLRECVSASGGSVSPDTILGLLSLVFWALTLVVTVKYVAFIMGASYKGEGGIMSLLKLASTHEAKLFEKKAWLSSIGIVGAALFFGDGIMTPAMSILSAVEGLEVVAPWLKAYVIPVALMLITVLFLGQRHGTHKVGRLFGPVMLLWFAVLGLVGVWNIMKNPIVMAAINPWYALDFLRNQGVLSFKILGAVVLAVTGAEALYADMGHFGVRPIRLLWLVFVMPCLVINYFGQGSAILANPEIATNPFFLMFPQGSHLFVVILSAAATVIASQAVISGAYSLAQQAYQMGYLPRLILRHTSELEKGQIYLPTITWSLYLGVVLLVLGFQSSSNLASAYGIAVTGTMLTTSLLYWFVAKRTLGWSMISVAAIVLVFVSVDVIFLSSNLTKISEGGWLPLLVGFVLFVLMSTWCQGRLAVIDSVYPSKVTLDTLISAIGENQTLPGSAVFLSEPGEGVPNALIKSLNHYRRVHERLVILTVEPTEVPVEDGSSRFMVKDIGRGIQRVIIRFGYMQEQNVPESIREMEKLGLLEPTTGFSGYYFSRIRPRVGSIQDMPLWREFIFLFLLKNSSRAPDFFFIPSSEVVEFNMHV
jgi:KUP system potassium uptake protein